MFVRVPGRNPSTVTEKLEATQTWFSVTVEMLSEKPLAFVWKMLGNTLEVLPSRSASYCDHWLSETGWEPNLG